MSYVFHASPLLHRWNGAISHAFSRARAEATRDDGTVAHRDHCSSTARTGARLLTVTVGAADVCRVRRALSYCGPNSVEFVKLTRVARDNRVRLQIALNAGLVREAMSKIIASVGEAEFGRITGGKSHSNSSHSADASSLERRDLTATSDRITERSLG